VIQITRNGPAARAEWRQNWPLVLSVTGGIGVIALHLYTLGIFVEPLESEFGWSRTQITSGLTIVAVITTLFGPLVGAVVDRVGPRRMAIPGVAVYLLFFGGLFLASNSLILWWSLWLGIAAGCLMLTPAVWAAAIISRFDAARGLALAIGLSGLGISSLIAPLVAGYLIENYGWRVGFAGVALLYFAVAMSLVVSFFYSAADLDRVRVSPDQVKSPKAAPLPGLSVKEAFASSTFWKLAIGTLAVMLTIIGGIVHFVPIVTDAGLDRASAIVAASAIGGTAILARLVTGSLLDRLDGKIVGGFAFMLPAVACLGLLFYDGSFPFAFAIALGFGVCVGAELEVMAYLSSRHFGMRNFGILFGCIAAMSSVAGGVGPFAGSFAYDQTGSYSIALWAGAALCVLSGLLIFSLRNCPARW